MMILFLAMVVALPAAILTGILFMDWRAVPIAFIAFIAIILATGQPA